MVHASYCDVSTHGGEGEGACSRREACSQASMVYRSRVRPAAGGGYYTSFEHVHHAMPSSSGYGNTYHVHGHTHSGHTNSHACTCGVGEVCREDKYGQPFCQPDPHYGSSQGGVRGQCMYLDYPTSCLRPNVPGAVTRYTYRSGRCMAITVSGVARGCRPLGMANNIFRFRSTCQNACLIYY
ncbi:uncharacterized protein LOC143281690 [Babylonia areolata]|uniref:uncharacterized protein LOC143281690 n=1 Tax=Babylonia areolata TaxID=304850 RepID=UPI003FD6B96C